jgi:hypothetical protein
VVTIWLTKISISQMTKYVDLFFPLSTQDFYRTLLYIWLTRLVSYKKQELLTINKNLGSPPVFDGVRVAHLFIFFSVLCFCVLLVSCHVSCVPNVASVSCHVSCLPNVASVSWLPIRVSLTFILTTSPTPLKWTRALIPTSWVKVSRPIYKAGCFTGHLDISLWYFLHQ